MSFTLELIINPIALSLAVIGGALAGFIIGRGKLAKARGMIQRLESDLVLSNHETLDAQKELIALQTRVQEQSIPVIPMKITGGKDNNSKEKASK
ncbi:MAG TPA: hypothetical protein VNW04_11220 [Puia sp.]|jgi:hypothetical protein|nr:hypothetical protein [Puia sp.]